MASASAGALALDGNLAAVEALLAAQGDGVVNVPDEDGRTMLHWASSGGHTALVTCLLEHGAMANALDELGWTPLHIAVSGGHAEIVAALVSAGGDPFAINSSGQLALHYASSRNRLDCARLLLDTAGERAAAMASFPDRGNNTPLHRAAAAGLTDMITVLLEAGSEVCAVDRDGSTALHLATVEQQPRAVQLLAHMGGAELLAVKDADGKTAGDIASAKAKALYGMGEARDIAVEIAEALGMGEASGGSGGSGSVGEGTGSLPPPIEGGDAEDVK